MIRANDRRAVRRIVPGSHGEYVVEVRPDGLVMRPLRARRGGPSQVTVRWESIYIRGFEPRPRRRRIRRGKI